MPVSSHVSNIPDWVDKAIKKAVQVDPINRYEKMSELESDLRKPNPVFLKEDQLPLMQRNPLDFWKTLSGLLLLGNMILLYFLSI